MRDLVITRLTDIIKMSDGYGIPRCFDCDEDEMITDPTELNSMTDEELLVAFEAAVGFGG